MKKFLVSDKAKLYWVEGLESRKNPGKFFDALIVEYNDSGNYIVLTYELGKACRMLSLSERDFVLKYLSNDLKK